MYCPAGNATGPIWRLLASSLGISSWTPLKPQHSNPNPKPLANQLWCIDFLTPTTPLIISHRLLGFLESLMPLKNWCSIHARWFKISLKHSIRICIFAYLVECTPMVRETGVQSQVRVTPKTLKMVLDTSLLNSQQYKVCIKGNVEQSRERSSVLSYTSV